MTFTPYNDAERLANDVLRAAGSGLHNYTMPATRKAIIDAATRPTDPQVTALVEALERINSQSACVALRHNAAEADEWLVSISQISAAALAAFGSKTND